MRKDVHRRLFPRAFSGSALAIFEQVASKDLDLNTDELWELLQAHLCDSSHQRITRMTFDTMAWEERKEQLSAFAHHLRVAALALPEAVSDERLIDSFTQSLHGCLRNHALPAYSPFDEFVGGVAMMLQTAIGEGRNRKRYERGREVAEGSRPETRVAQAADNVPAAGIEEGTRKDWQNTALCFRCGKRGHIADQCPQRVPMTRNTKWRGMLGRVGRGSQGHTPRRTSPQEGTS